MATQSQVYSATTAASQIRESVPITQKRLKAASVSLSSEGTAGPVAFVYISLTRSSAPDTLPAAILAAGWVSETSPIGWTGDLPVDPDCQVTFAIQSISTGHYQLGLTTE